MTRTRKGGHNVEPSLVKDRPAPPAAMKARTRKAIRVSFAIPVGVWRAINLVAKRKGEPVDHTLALACWAYALPFVPGLVPPVSPSKRARSKT